MVDRLSVGNMGTGEALPFPGALPAFRIGPAFRNRAKPSERKPTARSRATTRVPATSRACMCSNGIHLRGADVCRALALSRTTMARTMQSASKSTGRKAPRKQLAVKRLVKIRQRSSSRHCIQLIHPLRCMRRHLHRCALLPPHHRHRGQQPSMLPSPSLSSPTPPSARVTMAALASKACVQPRIRGGCLCAAASHAAGCADVRCSV